MKLFDFSFKAPETERPRKKGIPRYFEVLWEHIGKLLLLNVICFASTLPLALFTSLGVVYNNFWISVLGGALGGMIAGPFWTAALAVSFICFQNSYFQWFAPWRQALKESWVRSSRQGALIGAVFGALLTVTGFCVDLLNQGTLPELPVWAFLEADFLVIAAAAALLFPPLCFSGKPFTVRLKEIAELLRTSPGRFFSAVLGMLIWCTVFIVLFPACVPFAAIFGFFPLSLFIAQILNEWILKHNSVPDVRGGDVSEVKLENSRKAEVFWLRCGPAVLGALVVLGVLFSVVNTALNFKEPDLQIAVVHSSQLPDSVKSAMEESIALLVGDLNNDKTPIVQVNDYVMSFDGTEKDSNVQTAGAAGLVTDIAGKISGVFVVEDAEGFLSWYGDQVVSENALPWDKNQLLSSLDIGVYSNPDDIYTELDGQDLLKGYMVYPSVYLSGETAALFN